MDPRNESKKSQMNSPLSFLIALLLVPLSMLHADDLRLPSIFSDHMVLSNGQGERKGGKKRTCIVLIS
jgi:hypothetical protein